MATTNHLRISALALVLALAAVVLASLVANPALAAATITVNAKTDENNSNGNCTLREAIIAANTDAPRDGCPAGTSGVDTIKVPAGNYLLTNPKRDDEVGVGPVPGAGDLDILDAPGPTRSATIITGAGADKTSVVGTSVFPDQIFENVETTTKISGLTITGGKGYHGGVENNAGTLTLDQVAITDNTGSWAGGVASFANSPLDELAIFNSTVSGNRANTDYGGVVQQDGYAIIQNSTISGNQGHGVTAIHFDSGDLETPTMDIQHSTIANNTYTGDGSRPGAGIDAENLDMVVRVKNTIVSDNNPDNCTEFGGTITSEGYNISKDNIGTDNDARCHLTQSGDKPNTNPKLGPLENNGGPTDTHALLKGSTALNAIPKGVNGCGPEEIYRDQRGVKRPQGTKCDIGAYEKKVRRR